LNKMRRRWISSQAPADVRQDVSTYGRNAIRNTILPPEVRFYVRQAVMAEFKFDIEPQ
jgi:hypothetical protein